jgi:hypothetical protein
LNDTTVKRAWIFVQVRCRPTFHAAGLFDPAGTQQAWFTGVGTYSGNTATIAAVSNPPADAGFPTSIRIR